MNRERSECLGCSLAETDIGQARLLRGAKDIVNRVGNVVESEVICEQVSECMLSEIAVHSTHAEVPKLHICRSVVQRLLAVFIASVVSKPDIIALVDQQKGQTPLVLGNAHPDLAVHHEAMMEVDDLLLHTPWPAIYALVLLPFAPGKPVNSQEEAVLRLDYMLLGRVAI